MMTAPRPLPLRLALTGLLLAPVLTGCSRPAAQPPAAAAVPTASRNADVIGFFGGGDVFVVYDRDSNGLPTALRRVTTDPGSALEPFLTLPAPSRPLDCLRLTPPPATDPTSAPLAGLCDAALWRSRAAEGTSPLALSDGRATLTRLTDTTLSQMRQAVSGLGSLTGGTAAAPPESPATTAPASATPLVEAARRVIPLLALGYSSSRTAALQGGDTEAAAFLHTYPAAPGVDRLAVTEAALRQTLSQTTQTPGELRRVLRVLPLTTDQKAQGLDALRRFRSLDGWLSALRLGGSATDLRQARALAATPPGQRDTHMVEESVTLDQALKTPGKQADLFNLSAPAHWDSRPGQPDSLSLGTTVLSAPVTLSARPAARLRTGTYDVTVRVSAASTRTYSHQTPQGETVQAIARSSTETDVVFTLSPPAYRQTLTITLPDVPSPDSAPPTVSEVARPEVTLTIRAVDLKP